MPGRRRTRARHCGWTHRDGPGTRHTGHGSGRHEEADLRPLTVGHGRLQATRVDALSDEEADDALGAPACVGNAGETEGFLRLSDTQPGPVEGLQDGGNGGERVLRIGVYLQRGVSFQLNWRVLCQYGVNFIARRLAVCALQVRQCLVVRLPCRVLRAQLQARAEAAERPLGVPQPGQTSTAVEPQTGVSGVAEFKGPVVALQSSLREGWALGQLHIAPHLLDPRGLGPLLRGLVEVCPSGVELLEGNGDTGAAHIHLSLRVALLDELRVQPPGLVVITLLGGPGGRFQGVRGHSLAALAALTLPVNRRPEAVGVGPDAIAQPDPVALLVNPGGQHLLPLLGCVARGLQGGGGRALAAVAEL
mmetsp:Transcript_39051/g.69971  ORF Transcript_39051/g.69971 Transcript_39051/m.69971 type:complete len:362 (-) Transcript_39051:2765-3850(-)